MFRFVIKSGAPVFIIKRNAGHSKWANIKHTKSQKDSEKSIMISNFCKRIKVAVKDGGSANPDHNIQLSQIIATARKMSMPVITIENCLKSAENDKSQAASYWLDIRGPSGCFIVVHTLTDQKRKTRDTIASILKKHKSNFSDGAFKRIFEHKGEIIAIPPSGLKNIEDMVIEHAIESGAEEVFVDESEEGAYKFICEMNMLSKVNSKLQVLKYDVKSADFSLIPLLKVSLSDEDIEIMSKLIGKLEDHPDVVTLYDNIA